MTIYRREDVVKYYLSKIDLPIVDLSFIQLGRDLFGCELRTNSDKVDQWKAYLQEVNMGFEIHNLSMSKDTLRFEFYRPRSAYGSSLLSRFLVFLKPSSKSKEVIKFTLLVFFGTFLLARILTIASRWTYAENIRNRGFKDSFYIPKLQEDIDLKSGDPHLDALYRKLELCNYFIRQDLIPSTDVLEVFQVVEGLKYLDISPNNVESIYELAFYLSYLGRYDLELDVLSFIAETKIKSDLRNGDANSLTLLYNYIDEIYLSHARDYLSMGSYNKGSWVINRAYDLIKLVDTPPLDVLTEDQHNFYNRSVLLRFLLKYPLISIAEANYVEVVFNRIVDGRFEMEFKNYDERNYGLESKYYQDLDLYLKGITAFYRDDYVTCRELMDRLLLDCSNKELGNYAQLFSYRSIFWQIQSDTMDSDLIFSFDSSKVTLDLNLNNDIEIYRSQLQKNLLHEEKPAVTFIPEEVRSILEPDHLKSEFDLDNLDTDSINKIRSILKILLADE